ncbi:acid protease [Microthyrium microscopicum]|uniref:Acid protease n=1 Tax=Microthyrium microscopicum TaxID=703497 RepID=A0A6A6UIR9_9PEZI|nr:acid protease [Microthyrium microscopicum]
MQTFIAYLLFAFQWLAILPGILASPKVISLDFDRYEVFGDTKPGLRRRDTSGADITNSQGSLLYLLNVTIGTPPQKLSLQLDTGSSDIWLPWAKSSQCSNRNTRCSGSGSFDETLSSSYQLLQASTFLISYVDGTKIRGDYIRDNLAVGSSSVINMTMGLAKTASEQDNVSPFQGIIGVGFETGEAVYAQTGQVYPNIISQFKASGAINTRAYSLWLNSKENGKGTILFGGVDTAKYSGDLVSLPIQPDARTGTVMSFTVALDNFNVMGANSQNQYSKSNLSLPVILDSGTTLTYLPDSMANDLYTGVGATVSTTYGVVVPCDLQNSAATFNFGFGNPNGPVITAPIAQFVLPFPADIPAPTFRSTGKVACRWGIQAAANRPILFGDTFLRGAYVVYNLDNNEIGLANAIVNATTSNVKEITAKQIPGITSTAAGVAKQTASGLQGPNSAAFSTGSGVIATATGPAFNLGSSTAGASSSNAGGKKSAAGVNSPSMGVVTMLAGVVSIMAILGGALLLG